MKSSSLPVGTSPLPGGPPEESKNWWWNVVILLVVIGGLYGVFHFRPFRFWVGTGHPLVGEILPVVKLESVEPGQQGLGPEDLQGQVVLLCFWGPWSEISRRAMPRVVELSAPYRKRPDFRLVLIACPRTPQVVLEEFRTEVRATVREWQLDVPVYIDPDGQTLARFRARQGLEQLPTIYLVDRLGNIQAVWPGYQHEVEKELRELLEEKLPPPEFP